MGLCPTSAQRGCYDIGVGSYDRGALCPPIVGSDPVGILPRSLTFNDLVQCRLVTDRQTDRHDDSIYRASIASRSKRYDYILYCWFTLYW